MSCFNEFWILWCWIVGHKKWELYKNGSVCSYTTLNDHLLCSRCGKDLGELSKHKKPVRH